MLHRTDLHTSLRQSGRTFHLFYLLQKSRNGGLIGQIHPPKLITKSRTCRFDAQTHLGPAVQGGPRQTGFTLHR